MDAVVKLSVHLGWPGLFIFTALLLSSITHYPALLPRQDPITAVAPVECPGSTGVPAVTFVPTEPMRTEHYYHTATLLKDGTVLMVAGFGFRVPTSAAELYDPASWSFNVLASDGGERFDHTATLLPNSTVLIVGGRTRAGFSGPFGPYVPTTSAVRYTSIGSTFTAAGNLQTARAEHTATLLPNGQVLIAGGSTATTAPELYNPATGAFTATGNLQTARVGHTATLLQQGCVLIVSGNSAEIYGANTGKFYFAGKLPAYVNIQGHTSTLLPDGTVLIAGGVSYGFGLHSAWLGVKGYQIYLPIMVAQ
jgi:hypothetical protein